MDSTRRGHILFVYGTLLREGTARDILAGSEYLGETAVAGTLFDLGFYPALLLEGRGTVHGEMWRCGIETLARLDSYEGVSEELFRRVQIELTPGTGWTYVAGPALDLTIASARVIASGRWIV